MKQRAAISCACASCSPGWTQQFIKKFISVFIIKIMKIAYHIISDATWTIQWIKSVITHKLYTCIIHSDSDIDQRVQRKLKWQSYWPIELLTYQLYSNSAIFYILIIKLLNLISLLYNVLHFISSVTREDHPPAKNLVQLSNYSKIFHTSSTIF